MGRWFALVLLIILSAAVTPTIHADSLPHADLVLWHSQGETIMNNLGIQKIFDNWAATHAPGSTLTLVQKEDDDLPVDFPAAVNAKSNPPDLIWTGPEAVQSFAQAGSLLPVDTLIDRSLFIPALTDSTTVGGKLYGIPLQVGNHLMLFYNKKYVKDAPQTFDELVKIAQSLQQANANVDGFQPFAYNQKESLWVFPLAHAFGATEFNGATPALDSDGWGKAYQLLNDLKFKAKIEAQECDYECADSAFRLGKAAMTLNGDWALTGDTGYIKALGADLGIAAWPSVGFDPRQAIPAPFFVGQFLSISKSASGDHLKTAQAFAQFLATDQDTALSWTVPNYRLPALLSALHSDKITSDPVLGQTSKVLATAVIMPTQPGMACVIHAVSVQVRLIVNDSVKAAEAAKSAQQDATDCIAAMKTGS